MEADRAVDRAHAEQPLASPLRDLSGRSRSQTFDRKVDATRFLERTAADLQRGEWTDPALLRSTFGSWAETWFDTTAALKPSTRVGYRHALDGRVLPYWRERPLGTIDRAEVRKWVAGLIDDGLSPKWVRNVVSVFSLVLEPARDAGAFRRPRGVTRYVMERQIHESAYKHGIRAADMLHVMDQPTVIEDVDHDKVLYLGWSSDGRLLEVLS